MLGRVAIGKRIAACRVTAKRNNTAHSVMTHGTLCNPQRNRWQFRFATVTTAPTNRVLVGITQVWSIQARANMGRFVIS